MTENARPSEVSTLADALRDAQNVRVPLGVIWELWTRSAPRLAGSTNQAAALEGALRDLAERGIVELPVGAWDTSTVPPLPRSVAVPTARRTKRARGWVSFPWRRELGWAASLPSLSDALFGDLIAINDWLSRTGATAPLLPVRYRSAEIFRDEKRLEALARTSLFGAGRLSFELLACVRRAAPLPTARVGDGPDLLVVENSDTYWVAVDTLSGVTRQPVGTVAWGSGETFPSQIQTLGVDIGGQGPLTGRCWYWGDLDPAGLRIAAAAAAEAEAAGVARVLPAATLWAAMAVRPVQSAGKVDWSGSEGRIWLGDELWECLTGVRLAMGRVAQEMVPPTAIYDWAQTLG